MTLPTQAAEGPLFAVCYDVSNDRERYRVDKLLKGYGFRVQKSVFECRLNTAARQRLRAQLDALHLHSGHVRLYHVLSGAAAQAVGNVPAAPDACFGYSI